MQPVEDADKTITPPGERYFELVRECPLREIKNEAELQQALAMVDRMVRYLPDIPPDEDMYLGALSTLVEVYENEHYDYEIPKVSDGELLHILIESKGVSYEDVADATGVDDAAIASIIDGTRLMTRDEIMAFARYFQVCPSLFLPKDWKKTKSEV